MRLGDGGSSQSRNRPHPPPENASSIGTCVIWVRSIMEAIRADQLKRLFRWRRHSEALHMRRRKPVAAASLERRAGGNAQLRAALRRPRRPGRDLASTGRFTTFPPIERISRRAPGGAAAAKSCGRRSTISARRPTAARARRTATGRIITVSVCLRFRSIISAWGQKPHVVTSTDRRANI
jgi:hypothetical protein